MPTVVGVDLAVPGRGWIGLAAVEARSLVLESAALTREAVYVAEYVMSHVPHMVVIDAPLSLPERGGFRRAERWAMRMLSARLLPLTLASMRLLASTGAELRQRLQWTTVVETHPSSAARLAGAADAEAFLECLGLSPGLPRGMPRSKRRHVVDAVVAAAVGALLARGEALLYGDDAVFVFPRPGLCAVTTREGRA